MAIDTTGNVKEKRLPDFDSAEYKSKRLQIFVNEAADKKIRSESAAQGITITDYVVSTAMAYRIGEEIKKLDATLRRLKKYMQENNIKFSYKAKKKKGDVVMAKKEGTLKQFHLRVTPSAYEEIKRKATQMSLTVSDYVVFVTTNYDVMEISRKIDEINARLDVIMSKKGGQAISGLEKL